MDPPEWALLQRELLHAHTAACVKFFQRYFNRQRLAGDHASAGAAMTVPTTPSRMSTTGRMLYALGGDEVLQRDVHQGL